MRTQHQISMENWSSSVFGPELTRLFFSALTVSSFFPRPEVIPEENETCTKVGHFNVQHQSCKQSNEVLTTLSSGRYLNFSLPGMLGMFFGGVLARGEFLMLIRKFLSYLKSWPVNHRPIRGHYRLHIHSILVPPGNQKPGSRST